LPEKSTGIKWPEALRGGVCGPTESGVWIGAMLPPLRNFLEFSNQKNAGFYHFYAFILQKNHLWGQKAEPGWELVRPLGAEDVKLTGVENLAGSSVPPNPSPVNSHPCNKPGTPVKSPLQ